MDYQYLYLSIIIITTDHDSVHSNKGLIISSTTTKALTVHSKIKRDRENKGKEKKRKEKQSRTKINNIGSCKQIIMRKKLR